jgi:hypothetical protein
MGKNKNKIKTNKNRKKIGKEKREKKEEDCSAFHCGLAQ